jgi:HD-GYP domain-containing protein (c-di-GMP phosphodiesterase class II)
MREDAQSLPSVAGPTAEQTADRERRRQVLADARQFLLNFGSLVRQLMVHDASNNAVVQVLRATFESLAALRAHSGSLVVVFTEGHTFANGVWVRSTGRAWEASVFLTETLEKLRGRGFIIEPECGINELLKFTQLIRAWAKANQRREELDEEIGIPGVRLILLRENDEEGSRAQLRDAAIEVFQEGLHAVGREQVATLDVYMRRRQRSLVLRLVQMAEENPEDLLLLTTLRDPTLPPATHALSVCILSIALGRLLDLRRRDLVRLGVVALNHNVGEALVPEEYFTIERELTHEEREVVEAHPLLGMRHLLEHYGFDLQIVERAIASAEHHLRVDGTGYPVIGHEGPHVFSRIIAVADVFNALANMRPYRPAYPPDQAMKLVRRQAVSLLDPLLVRTLVRLVGRYPPGSLVELDTGEYGLVLGPGRGADPLHRPRVLLLTDTDGFELEEFVCVDLGERHPRRRAWLRTIVRTRDPRRLGRSVSSYLLADRIEHAPSRMDNDEPAKAAPDGADPQA